MTKTVQNDKIFLINIIHHSPIWRTIMSLIIRNSIQILLLNPENKLLLMCADDPKTTTVDGEYHGKFWFPIGGEIEEGESIEGLPPAKCVYYLEQVM